MKDITKTAIRFTLVGTALAAALAASGGAEATEVIGIVENNVGGEILLTDTKCGAKGKGRITMATDVGGPVTSYGCAHPLPPDRALVQWNNGAATVIPMRRWAPENTTGRSLKSFSRAELDMLFMRQAWFEGVPLDNEPAPAPRAKPAVIRRDP